jgi:NADH-quinone oxidoreductase subunit K
MIDAQMMWTFFVFVILMMISGLYCVMVTHNLMKLMIGLELMIKAVTLLLAVVGYVTGHVALIQSLIITLIVIEVVIMTVAVGVVLGIYFYTGSLDAKEIRRMKG